MSGLLKLAERCEAATGPSLALDRDIALLIYTGARLVPGNDSRVSVWDGNGRTQLTVKPYTASLDVAMTLVPDGAPWSLNDPANADGSRSVFGYASRCHAFVVGGPNPHDYGATPALALCAAALRARDALTNSEGGGE